VFGLAASLLSVILEGGGLGGVASLAERPAALKILGYVFAGLCVPLLFALGFKSYKCVVPGANDNLTGCFTAMAVAKLLGDLNLRLEHTELVILASGSEEAGLRGAKDFAKRHAEEYKDVETALIALDTMRDYEHMGIYITDLTGTIKHDAALCALMRAGAEAAGHQLPYNSLFFGASDAAAATQAGIRAATFAAMDPAPAAYYHTRLDTAENLDPKTMEACLDIILEITHQFDSTGLEPFLGAKVKVGG
ncbi:MAG: M20/M25/M40 family metallo-hydrolase, partial [Oscillospiraceae bacterium]|jgi:Zn-dependent M28 family amino/carboxypeptidase|nr:M20/M25/M40 family metallo-hydrolase [Oscillospiraceae bacterium]